MYDKTFGVWSNINFNSVNEDKLKFLEELKRIWHNSFYHLKIFKLISCKLCVSVDALLVFGTIFWFLMTQETYTLLLYAKLKRN